MVLSSVFIQSLRNLAAVEFNPGACNIIYGDNGSGKTSILEAIYLLATGRSFRAQQLNYVIQQGEPHATVRAIIRQQENTPDLKVAIQKARSSKHVVKVGGQEVASVAEIAKYLPVQALHLLNYQLLQASPELRRKQLDWAVFHVKHLFLEKWRNFNQLLKQRNAALRQQRPSLFVWEQQLALAGDEIHALRQQVCAEWLPQAQALITQFLEFDGVTVEYLPGWDVNLSLQQVFAQNLDRDLSLGYTYNGPQRADLQVKYRQQLAQQVLSQGQQKRLVTALQLSQGAWVQAQTGQPGVLLIDDLPAELDLGARRQLMHVLSSLNMQVFLTCVDEGTAKELGAQLPAKMFHVKHGHVQEVV